MEGLPESLEHVHTNDTFVKLYKRFWTDGENPISIDSNKTEFIQLGDHIPPFTYESFNPHLRLIVLPRYRYFEERILALRNSPSHADSGLILTGQSGIGKSCFLLYLLIRYLSQKQPVIYQHFETTYVFANEGVFTVKKFECLRNTFFRRIPALVDDMAGPPPPGLVLASPAFPIHATAPLLSNYNNWRKHRRPSMFVMNPLSRSEMLNFFSTIYPDHTLDQVDTWISLYGRDIRTIRTAILSGIYDHEREVQEQINYLDIQTLADLLRNPHEAHPTASDCLIQTLRAKPLPDPTSVEYIRPDWMVHAIASRYIYRKLWKHFREKGADAHQSFLEKTSGPRSAVVMRGWAFENWCHEQLCESASGGELVIQKMALSEDSTVMKRNDDSEIQIVPIRPKRVETYTSTMHIDRTRDASVYYLPEEANNPAFDSYIRLSDDLGVAFQMTISSKYSLNIEGLSLLSSRLATKQKYCVFVIPEGHAFQCPAPPKPWGSDYEFYTLEIALELPAPLYLHGDSAEDLDDTFGSS
ncbi:hypothetical protein ONZ45_g3216 [Pleurotus djamor]|nr:hypothetical protein ONZ45_g3216 [Pleurotus djamor]